MDKDQIASMIRGYLDDGLACSTIAEKLNAEGIPSLSGGTWTKGSVEGIKRRYLKSNEHETPRAVQSLPISDHSPEIEQLKTKIERLENEINRMKYDAVLDRLNELTEIENVVGELRLQLETARMEIERLKRSRNRLRKAISDQRKRDKGPSFRNFEGWTLTRNNKGEIRLQKRISGKTRGIFIGKVWDSQKARMKINAKINQLIEQGIIEEG